MWGRQEPESLSPPPLSPLLLRNVSRAVDWSMFILVLRRARRIFAGPKRDDVKKRGEPLGAAGEM